MTVKQLSQRSQQVVDKLDEIIVTAKSSSQELSFSKEVILKLISAMAIAILVEHLLISDKSNWIVPLNSSLLIAYLIGLILFGNYVIGKPRSIALRLIQSIAVAIYGIYTLGVLDNPWNLAQSQYLNILYFISLFCLAVAELFYLANYGYPTPDYVDRDLYENHEALVTERLSEFSAEEISSTISQVEQIKERLDRAVSSDIYTTGLLSVTIFLLSLVLFLPIDLVQSELWFDRAAFYWLCFLIFFSLIAIVANIKDIKNHRDSNRFAQYLLIIESYDYLVTKTYRSRIAKELARFKSEFF